MSGLLDAAIAIHPREWRERYGAEVRGILLDVADERGGRVPLTETVPLGLRGLWMRARASVIFWAGLVVVGIFVVSGITADIYYVDGSLTDLMLLLNGAVGFALAVIALASGWVGARARTDRVVGIGSRLRRLTSDSWPLLAFVAGGHGAAIVLLVLRAGAPWFTSLGVMVIVGQAAMVLTAVAVGQLLGAVLPRVLVIFVAPAAIATVTLLLFAWTTPWNVAPWGLYAGLAFVIDTAPVVRVLAVAAAVVAGAILAVAVRAPWLRALPFFALLAVGVVVSTLPTEQSDAAPFVERPQSQLVCSAVEPVICLWPEQEAAFGASLRAQMTEGYATAVALGLPVDSAGPRSVLQFGMTAIPAAEDADWEDMANMGLGTTGVGPGDLLGFYAYSIPSCCWQEPTSGEGDYQAVAYAVSILLGLSPEEAWPAMIDPYTGHQQFDPSSIPDEAAARVLVERWLSEGVNGASAPS